MAARDRLTTLLQQLDVDGELDAGRDPLEIGPGDPPSELGRGRLAAAGDGPALLGRPLRLEGELEARATAAAALGDGWPFPDEVPILPEGVVVGRLEARFAASAKRSRSRLRGPHLTLGLGGRTSVELGVTTLLKADDSRRDALRQLLAAARWPLGVELSDLRSCEALTLRTVATLDLGLGLEAGWAPALPGLEPLLGEPGSDLTLAFDAVVRASFGLALSEELELSVARAPGLTGDPSWVRLSVRRRHESRFTLGARLALELAYDLGRPLDRLLDRTLERPGWARLARALDELRDLTAAARLAADGRWPELADLVGSSGGELVAGLLRRSGLLEHRDLERLLAQVADVADAWRALPERLQDLWDELLDGAGLGEGSSLVAALETVAVLDEALDRDGAEGVLEQLLGNRTGRWREALQLLELLTGHDLEELVVAGDELEAHLRRVAALADRALAFRDRLEALPDTALDALRRTLDGTSLAAVLRVLGQVESSGDLARLVGTHAGDLAARRLGLALERATPADLEGLRRWAADLAALLEAPGQVAALRSRIAELDGAVGCSLALELEWASRRTALLDLELDPGQPLARQVLADVAEGSLVGALRRLDDAARKDPSHFRLRDALLTSRRTRATAADLVLSLLGADRDRTRRVTESWLRASDVPEPSRRARFSGGLARRVELAGTTATAEAWLALRTEGPGLDPAAAFAGPARAELRLSWSRYEPRLGAGGAASIRGLLTDLGLIGPADELASLLAPGLEVRAAVTLRLGDDAAQAFPLRDRGDDRGWLADHLNALCRWLADPAAPWSAPGRKEVARGAFLAALMRSELYRPLRGLGALELEQKLAGHRVTVVVPDRAGHRRRVSAILVRHTTGATSPHPAFTVLATAAEARLGGGRSLVGLETALADVRRASELPRAALEEAVDAFVRTLARATVDDWPEPSLPIWLVLARLCRLAPEALASATGVATVRARTPGEPEWTEVRTLRLTGGLPRHRIGDPHGPFPVRP